MGPWDLIREDEDGVNGERVSQDRDDIHKGVEVSWTRFSQVI